jgi:hypothetical protein
MVEFDKVWSRVEKPNLMSHKTWITSKSLLNDVDISFGEIALTNVVRV